MAARVLQPLMYGKGHEKNHPILCQNQMNPLPHPTTATDATSMGTIQKLPGKPRCDVRTSAFGKGPAVSGCGTKVGSKRYPAPASAQARWPCAVVLQFHRPRQGECSDIVGGSRSPLLGHPFAQPVTKVLPKRNPRDD